MNEETFRLLYLDEYHASDTLFLQGLARSLRQTRGTIVVHGSGEYAERLLEGSGIFLERIAGLLPVSTRAEHALVERALGELNHKIVDVLADQLVSAVGVAGGSRTVLTIRSGRVVVEEAGWLLRLVADAVVPVVAAYARDRETKRTGEVSLAEAVVALGHGVAYCEVLFLAKGKLSLSSVGGSLGVPDASGLVADPEGLACVLDAGLPVILTTPTLLTNGDGLRVVHVAN